MSDYGTRVQKSVDKALDLDDDKTKKKSMWEQLKELVPAMTYEERTKRMKRKAEEAENGNQ